jgi:methylenetetrahydrofolate reductase (NADPH)
MNDEVPGVFVPEKVLKRMENAEKAGNEAEEGVQIALELIENTKKLHGQGVNGIHIMAVGWEDIIPRLVGEAGLTKKQTREQ